MTLEFEAVCLPHRSTMYARAMRLTRNHEHAEDLVQDAYMRALCAWSEFEVPEGEEVARFAKAWLTRIVTNLFISVYRKNAWRASVLEEAGTELVEWTMGSSGAPPALEIYPERMTPEVTAALGELDPATRELVMRVDVQGELYRQAADNMKIPLGTVMSRLHRGRRKLAESLGVTRLRPERETVAVVLPDGCQLAAGR